MLFGKKRTKEEQKFYEIPTPYRLDETLAMVNPDATAEEKDQQFRELFSSTMELWKEKDRKAFQSKIAAMESRTRYEQMTRKVEAALRLLEGEGDTKFANAVREYETEFERQKMHAYEAYLKVLDIKNQSIDIVRSVQRKIMFERTSEEERTSYREHLDRVFQQVLPKLLQREQETWQPCAFFLDTSLEGAILRGNLRKHFLPNEKLSALAGQIARYAHWDLPYGYYVREYTRIREFRYNVWFENRIQEKNDAWAATIMLHAARDYDKARSYYHNFQQPCEKSGFRSEPYRPAFPIPFS